MSFGRFFSTKNKKEKPHKIKSQLSAQEHYELVSTYLKKFLQLISLTDGEHKNKLVVEFLKELHHDPAAISCRSGIREKFEKAYCAENIDFLFNYFDMTTKVSKEQWQAFYHQYVEEDQNNKSIKFTQINIDEADRILFLQLNGKILMGEYDIERIALHSSEEGKKSYTGRAFMEHMSAELTGYILGRNELVINALSELQQKALAAGAVPSVETKEENGPPKNRR